MTDLLGVFTDPDDDRPVVALADALEKVGQKHGYSRIEISDIYYDDEEESNVALCYAEHPAPFTGGRFRLYLPISASDLDYSASVDFCD